MRHVFRSTPVGLSLLCLMSAQSAMADTPRNQPTQFPMFLCQLGDTAELFSFQTDANGQWFGQGQLQGWAVSAQQDGWVARNGDDVLILENNSASLLVGGTLLKGQCVDAQSALAPLLQTMDSSAPAVQSQVDETANLVQDGSDPMVSIVLSLLDPDRWDAAKVAAIIDALNLDEPSKSGLKAELKAAASDPRKIAAIARDIKASLAREAATSADLRGQVKDLQRQLKASEQDLNEARQQANQTATLLTKAEEKARAAERAQHDMAAQLASLQAALLQSAADVEKVKSTLTTVVNQLAQAQAYLALANKRIVKLGGAPIRQ